MEVHPQFPEGILPNAAYLPYGYFKVCAFAFIYKKDPKDHLNATISIEAKFFDRSTYRNSMLKVGQLLLKKIDSWGHSHEEGFKKFARHESNVPRNLFIDTYDSLKKKYRHWASIWSDHTLSDPLKHVYEDIGIASFLICIWTLEAQKTGCNKKQVFVDIGCGNGFLVYLLHSEGYSGRGIDMKKRKIWEQLGNISLIAETIDPSKVSFPEADWIIGNHPDELTPWIPHIAKKSNASYFVLPCCFFDHFGRFEPANPKIGKYQTYLEYVRNLGKDCGFQVESETLCIPSTKNQCQIGRMGIE